MALVVIHMSLHNKEIEIPRSNPQYTTDESKILSNFCSIWSTRWILNGYGYPQGMGMGKDSYPRVWVRVRVEFCTHRLYGYGYGIALPCRTL
jgi:hypothetical protein